METAEVNQNECNIHSFIHQGRRLAMANRMANRRPCAGLSTCLSTYRQR